MVIGRKDFKKIEEHFGTLANFKKLVNEVHKRGMKIIVEFNANSVGPNHPWVNDLIRALGSMKNKRLMKIIVKQPGLTVCQTLLRKIPRSKIT